MEQFTVNTIGVLRVERGEYSIQLHPQYIPALAGLEGYGHICVLWWFSGCDDKISRGSLEEQAPYRRGPEKLGTFATRSPRRPNPIALTCAQITYVDQENGVVGITYTDADDGSPVLDLKPYVPSLDRVACPQVPDWCAHWPDSLEASGDFDWEAEFSGAPGIPGPAPAQS